MSYWPLIFTPLQRKRSQVESRRNSSTQIGHFQPQYIPMRRIRHPISPNQSHTDQFGSQSPFVKLGVVICPRPAGFRVTSNVNLSLVSRTRTQGQAYLHVSLLAHTERSPCSMNLLKKSFAFITTLGMCRKNN